MFLDNLINLVREKHLIMILMHRDQDAIAVLWMDIAAEMKCTGELSFYWKTEKWLHMLEMCKITLANTGTKQSGWSLWHKVRPAFTLNTSAYTLLPVDSDNLTQYVEMVLTQNMSNQMILYELNQINSLGVNVALEYHILLNTTVSYCVSTKIWLIIFLLCIIVLFICIMRNGNELSSYN